MHDIRFIREDFEAFRRAIARRPLSAEQQGDIAGLLELDASLRALTTAKQEHETARNAASKEIGKAKAGKDEARAAELMAEVAALKGKLDETAAKEAELLKKRDGVLASLPNLPAPETPDGADEHANVEVRRWYKGDGGAPPALDLTADHVTLGEGLGLMDFEAAARLSGARFVVTKGALARMERALAAFMLDLHTSEFGYTEVNPPLL
ncbi:MAG TPA: serine--tRNA ligase, partial [Terricaulis sp.]|nr:serine--tRNA ligase [Terricaulis sp.]